MGARDAATKLTNGIAYALYVTAACRLAFASLHLSQSRLCGWN